MRTITLELLRHGPAHNQLLSPLTPYLALCQNHAAVTLHLPFEHNQFLHRLSALGYQVSEQSRTFQLQDTARVLGDMLGTIPGLTAEANRESTDHSQLTHLRLIISAAELALLPFELALAPNGFPGAGQYLLLQPQMPVCLTREIRRVQGEQLQWPTKPRILFAAAAPPGVGAVPLESHLLALRRVIRPWVRYYDAGNATMRRERVEEHLVVLPAASIEAIEEHCASGNFTHVHILAHGVERRENYDTRFFLALHNARRVGDIDYISGARLAAALRPARRPESCSLARPVVVTLASCNSGNVGSVAGAGASIAHALHEAGIPMVIAGQFPLSFLGSVRLAEVLYDGLLWGTDPRCLLRDLRGRLFAQFRETHDWASMTAYVSLPLDFDQQLQDAQIEQAMHSVNAAMNHADEAIRSAVQVTGSRRRLSKRQTETTQPDTPVRAEILLSKAVAKIDQAKKRLERLLEHIPGKSARIYGLLASTEKRHAEVLYSAATVGSSTDPAKKQLSMERLAKSRDYYWSAFSLDPSKSWAAVQYLCLTLVLRSPDESTSPSRGPNLTELWSAAHLLATHDRNSQDSQKASWARGDLVELNLLSIVMPDFPNRPTLEEAQRQARENADTLIARAGRESFEVYSTRRQIYRYADWFSSISDTFAALGPIAEQILDIFPEDVEKKWR